MTLSRHKTIAQDVVDFLDSTWADAPAGVQVVRADSYELLVKDVEETDSAVIAVIVPNVSSEYADRGSDHDTVPVFVCIIASVKAKDTTLIDQWDLTTESCRDALRSRTLKTLSVSSDVVARRLGSVELPTTADADFLNAEVFFSVIGMRYQLNVQVSV